MWKAVDLSDKQGSRAESVEQITLELDVGLKSCRNLLDDYREKLSGKSVGGRWRLDATPSLDRYPADSQV